MIEKNKITEVYRRALILHKESWYKKQQGKAKYFWQKDKFDTSHLPEGFDDPNRWQSINHTISEQAKLTTWLNDGRFLVKLKFEDALILLIKLNYDNIHYINSYDIDLENYQLGAATYKIEII